MEFAKEQRVKNIGRMSSKSHFSFHICQRQFGDPKVS